MLPTSSFSMSQKLLFTVKALHIIEPVQTHKMKTSDSRMYISQTTMAIQYGLKKKNKLAGQGEYPEADYCKAQKTKQPLLVTFSPQLRPLTHITNALQPIIDENTSLSQALAASLYLVRENFLNLKQLLVTQH